MVLRGRHVVAAAVAALALLLGPSAGVAAAHDALVASTPADGSTPTTSPADVTLEFSNTPQPLGAQVVVVGPDGSTVSRGGAEAVGTRIVQPLSPELPAGTYTVDWRVVSADGHPLSGTLTFTVASGTETGTAPAAGAAAPTAGTGLGAARDDSSSAGVWIAVGATIALAAVVVTRQLRRPA